MSDILQEAREVMYGPRQDAYGDPVQTCAEIGRVWGALLGLGDIPAHRVALMMAGLKLVRESTGKPQRDNLVDAAAYVKIAEDAHERGEVDPGVAREIERFYVRGQEVASVAEWGHADTGAEWRSSGEIRVSCVAAPENYLVAQDGGDGEAIIGVGDPAREVYANAFLAPAHRVALARFLLTGEVIS